MATLAYVLARNRIWLQIEAEIQFADSTDSKQVWWIDGDERKKEFLGSWRHKGSRNNLEILNWTSPGSGVWLWDGYYKRQWWYVFFQVESDQTWEPCQKNFFKAKILIEVSKQLQKFVYRIKEEAFYFIL